MIRCGPLSAPTGPTTDQVFGQSDIFYIPLWVVLFPVPVLVSGSWYLFESWFLF